MPNAVTVTVLYNLRRFEYRGSWIGVDDGAFDVVTVFGVRVFGGVI